MSKFLTILFVRLIAVGLLSAPVFAQLEFSPYPPGVTFFGEVEKTKAEALSQEFRQAALTCFNKFKSLGVSQIENQKIDDIIERIHDIKIEFKYEVRMQSTDEAASYRGTAYWNKNLNTIFVAQRHWERTLKRKDSIACHEISGILGLSDDKFQLSSIIDVYTTFENASQKRPQIRNMKPMNYLKKNIGNEKLLQSTGGGVTGVDGGGDFRPLSYKSALIIEALFSFEDNKITEANLEHLINYYRSLEIEFSNLVPQGDFMLDGKQKKLYVPNNPFADGNHEVNNKTIQKFNDMLVQLIDIASKGNQ